MVQIELLSGLECHALASLLTSAILLMSAFRLNLGSLLGSEINALNSLESSFTALLGCIHPALLEASFIDPIFISRKFSEELAELSIFHKIPKKKPNTYRFISVWALFNFESRFDIGSLFDID